MKLKSYPLDELFGKPLRERHAEPIGSGKIVSCYKYVKDNIAAYIESIEGDEEKFEFLNKLLEEIQNDLNIDWVENNLMKFNNPNQMDEFRLYIEVLKTERYTKEKLAYMKRKYEFDIIIPSDKNKADLKSKTKINKIKPEKRTATDQEKAKSYVKCQVDFYINPKNEGKKLTYNILAENTRWKSVGTWSSICNNKIIQALIVHEAKKTTRFKNSQIR